MVLCLDYRVLALNDPRNILFQTTLINFEGLFAALQWHSVTTKNGEYQ
jgi:hypothetical protein